MNLVQQTLRNKLQSSSAQLGRFELFKLLRKLISIEPRHRLEILEEAGFTETERVCLAQTFNAFSTRSPIGVRGKQGSVSAQPSSTSAPTSNPTTQT
jgi:hypothetical protein